MGLGIVLADAMQVDISGQVENIVVSTAEMPPEIRHAPGHEVYS